MAEIHYWTVGDSLPPLRGTATDGDGNPVDLTTATGVHFFLREKNGTAVVMSGAGQVWGTPTAGGLEFKPGNGDIPTVPGKYEGEFEITFASGDVLTFPNRKPKIPVVITEQIGSAP